MAKRQIIAQFKAEGVTVTFYSKVVINGPFEYTIYYVDGYVQLTRYRENLYKGESYTTALAMYGVAVLKCLDKLEKCK